MDSWIAWGLRVCGHDDLYDASTQRIRLAMAGHPDALDPGYAYVYAFEGDTESLVDFLYRVADERHPTTFFIAFFRGRYPGWAVADTLPNDPRYIALIERLGFPAAHSRPRLAAD